MSAPSGAGSNPACRALICAVLRNDHHPAVGMTEHGMAADGPLVSLRAAAFQGATGRVDFKDDVATGEFLDRDHIDVS